MGDAASWNDVFWFTVTFTLIVVVPVSLALAARLHSVRKSAHAWRDTTDGSGLTIRQPSTLQTIAARRRLAAMPPGSQTPSPDSDIEGLISERRFRAAAALVDAADADGRARLAVLRGGPMADLLAARSRATDPELRKAAAGTLARLDATHFGALRGSVFGDDAVAWRRRCARLLDAGHFASAGAMMATIHEAFPHADDTFEWQFGAVAALSLAGQHAAAAAVAACTVSPVHLGTSDGAQQVATAHANLVKALAGGDVPSPARHRHMSRALWHTYDKLRRHPERTAAYPGAVADALRESRRRVVVTELTCEIAASAIARGESVHVGLLVGEHVRVIDILAIDPATETAYLTEGGLVPFAAIQRRSFWGPRMLVSARRRPHAPALELADWEMSPDLDRDGPAFVPGGWLDRLRSRVEADASNAALATAYLRALREIDGTVEGHPSAAEFLAVCHARFPSDAWPRTLQFAGTGADNDPYGQLLALTMNPDEASPGSRARAAAALRVTEGWQGWAEAELRDRANTGILLTAAHAAISEGRRADAQAHIELISTLDPQFHPLAHLRRLSQLALDGPHAMLAPLDTHDLADATLGMSLAMHTGDPRHLADTFAAYAELNPTDPVGGAVDAVLALHRGDAVGVAEAVARSVAVEGWTEVSASAARDAFRSLATSDTAPLMVDALLPASGMLDPRASMVALDAALSGHFDAASALALHAAEAGDSNAIIGHAMIALLQAHQTGTPRSAALELLGDVETTPHQYHRMLACAALIDDDPDRAWHLADVSPWPSLEFSWHVVIAALAEARGDAPTSALHLRRASNPDIVEANDMVLRALGLDAWAARALMALPPDMCRTERAIAWGTLLQGLDAPPAPAFREGTWSNAALDRAANEGHVALYLSAAAHRHTPETMLDFVDGTRGAAARALEAAINGDPEPLARLREASRHPGVIAAVGLWDRIESGAIALPHAALKGGGLQ